MEETLIAIRQDQPGFDKFIGSWLCRDEITMLVDVGPANTAKRFIAALEDLDVQSVDYILLSHIHIDHAGALAELLDRYPKAMAVCHEKGVGSLVAPDKLWQGSRKVLGPLAERYGEPRGVPSERLIPHNALKSERLKIIETPGHAPHHLSFCYGGRLFSGEAGGNYFVVGDEEYLRPATPPRFFLDVFLGSVDRLLSLEDQPICYAHFGKGSSSKRLLGRFREQVVQWKDWISRQINSGPAEPVETCVEMLLERDPNLRAFSRMSPGAQKRERAFMANAVRGFIGYFQERSTP
jgi:glyoxylase-like metal-dependent hydrolase (beta-lactamase superfamily II)